MSRGVTEMELIANKKNGKVYTGNCFYKFDFLYRSCDSHFAVCYYRKDCRSSSCICSANNCFFTQMMIPSLDKAKQQKNRHWVALDQISPFVREATIAIEDQRFFYDHYGFDVRRIAGAIVADIKAMAKVQGASTITQQYARNLYLSHDKTWKRKSDGGSLYHST
ncbi:hypothetical protein GCM10020331_021870 [Ectobacillus funiculus]